MLCLLLKGEDDRARHSKTHEKSTCAPTTGRGGVRRRVLGAKYKFIAREFWVLGTSTSALALFLPAAAKVSGGCQAELAAHLPGLLSHLQDSCPHAVNRSRVQLMIASKKIKTGRVGQVLLHLLHLSARRPVATSSSSSSSVACSLPPCTDVSSRR